MDIVSILFMAVISIAVLISTVIVVRETIKENGAGKRARIEAERERQADSVAAEKAAVTAQAEVQDTAAPLSQEGAEADLKKDEEREDAAEDSTVKFAVSQRQTLEEQYEALSDEQKECYDKIAAYAASKEGSKCNKNQYYQEYKLGSQRIVRMRIKRGMLQCEFLMINRELRNQIGENKNSVKESATIIKVQNADMIPVVLGSIDLAFQLIEEERAYKKQLARERRRQARMSR